MGTRCSSCGQVLSSGLPVLSLATHNAHPFRFLSLDSGTAALSSMVPPPSARLESTKRGTRLTGKHDCQGTYMVWSLDIHLHGTVWSAN
jgi:hypothetical protein